MIASAGAALRCWMAPRCPRCYQMVSFLSGDDYVFSKSQEQQERGLCRVGNSGLTSGRTLNLAQ